MSDEYLERPTPLEIARLIDDVEPSLRESVARSYVGKTVRWRLELDNRHVLSNGKVILALHCEEQREDKPQLAFVVVGVDAAIKLVDYPFIETTRPGERFEVTGIIDRIPYKGIFRLSDAKLKFLPAGPKPS
jgi:hypothetical protein